MSEWISEFMIVRVCMRLCAFAWVWIVLVVVVTVVCVGGERYLIERKDFTVRIDSTEDLLASRLTFKCWAWVITKYIVDAVCDMKTHAREDGCCGWQCTLSKRNKEIKKERLSARKNEWRKERNEERNFWRNVLIDNEVVSKIKREAEVAQKEAGMG